MFFKGKKVLIIGGTGSIGKNLVKTVLQHEPEVIRIFSRDEYKQFLLQNELGTRKDIRFLIGDVRNYDRILSAMADIDYVFHTAAMKHVPACEYNPYEAVLTNITGTYNVIKAANVQNVKKVVITSTDKAISPTNAYGATKLASERLVSSAEYSKGSSKTIFSSVRFGNVMGSRGSVVPLFINQIVNQRKVTVTDLTMSRFMMTLSQATDLTIKALQESKGGETFVLKMPIISLSDLVSVVIEETCHKYNIKPEEVEIQEVGLRPGEKMYEELMTSFESTFAIELPDMFVIPSNFTKKQLAYANAKKANYGTYSSNNQKVISKEKVRELLKTEKLI